MVTDRIKAITGDLRRKVSIAILENDFKNHKWRNRNEK